MGTPDLSHLVTSQPARLARATALQVFPNDITPCPLPADRTDAHSDTLRRAIVFIEDNAHRDIGLADIAASIPVTPRAVQYAFAQHADTTPLAHLRRVRLARAHEELRVADPATATVTAVAMRWGFSHQGRFAAAYRAAYGITPAGTLHS
ncbi:helix-turn-helix domain-containing protein [Streptomyces sp. NPDC048331]|uniref:helix-turn-helix domain-containing protein n=1 Tax=Streptomyces sp. NPDC048331 TaxID=3365534 RepID=UPI0037189ED0